MRVYSSRSSNELPNEGALVFLSFPESEVEIFRARVDDKLLGEPPEIVLTISDELLDSDEKQNYFLSKGQRLFMEWPSEDGYHRMPVELTTNESGQYVTFLAAVIGAGEVFERRQCFRVLTMSKAMIWGNAKTGVGVTMIDLSECGMRCTVNAATWSQSSETVDILLQAGDVSVGLRGKVARYTKTGETAELGIEFLLENERDATIIRRHLYDLQRSAIRGSVRK